VISADYSVARGVDFSLNIKQIFSAKRCIDRYYRLPKRFLHLSELLENLIGWLMVLFCFSINKSPQKKEQESDAKVTPCKRHRHFTQYGYLFIFILYEWIVFCLFSFVFPTPLHRRISLKKGYLFIR